MTNLIKFALDYIQGGMPNRLLFKTASNKAKRNIIRQMTKVIINHDRFINSDYEDINGCLKLKRKGYDSSQQRA